MKINHRYFLVDELKQIFTSDLTVNQYFEEYKINEDANVKQFLKIRFTILVQLYQKMNLVSKLDNHVLRK